MWLGGRVCSGVSVSRCKFSGFCVVVLLVVVYSLETLCIRLLFQNQIDFRCNYEQLWPLWPQLRRIVNNFDYAYAMCDWTTLQRTFDTTSTELFAHLLKY